MPEKIKILFHYSRLNIGGAERSTLRLMNELVANNWDVTLVLNVGAGTLEEKLDPKIKVVHFFPKPWKYEVVNQQNNLYRFFKFVQLVIPISFYTIFSFFKKLSFHFNKYDAAIISLQGLNPHFVVKFVKAKKKFIYIRNDISKIKNKKIKDSFIKYDSELDGYLCVSQTALESLDSINPKLKEKAHVLYNILDIQNIKDKAIQVINPFEKLVKENYPIIVTVCRMADVSKAIFRQLEVAIDLNKLGLNYYWFFIGDGPDLEEFKKRVVLNKMEKIIYTLGEKNNPYPFLLNADLVCVLSYYEGLSGVVNEAKVLGKPIIATQFSGINEQIINRKNGLIVENNLQSIIEGLYLMITDIDLRLSLSNDFLGSGIGNNKSKIEKLKKIILE